MPASPPSASISETSAVRSLIGGHPLEMFPYFRRFPCSPLRDIIYTFIWSGMFAVIFITVPMILRGTLPTPQSAVLNFLFANAIGYTIHLIFFVAARTVGPWLRQQGIIVSVLVYALVTTVGVVVGMMLAQSLLGFSVTTGGGTRGQIILSVAMTSLLVSVVMATIFLLRERRVQADARGERERVRIATIERDAMLATLKSLQAQIEPHFLFNTLANVVGLIDTEPVKARRMLENFIRFLRTSLAATRQEHTTLADDFALIGNYLDIIAVRMGDRLRVRMDLPDAMRNIELPPLLLQPLVENAIRHGLEPMIEGGVITLRAQENDGRVVVDIADTGVGFADKGGGGIGLDNVRDRLRLQFGAEGRLTIRENSPQGTIASVEFPGVLP